MMSSDKIPEQRIDAMVKKCVNFTGVMNTCCKAGVIYSEIIAGPMKFPCLSTGGSCSKAQFPTREEAEKEERKMLKDAAKVLEMVAAAMQHQQKTKSKKASIPCPCGGTMTYAVASNGHIRAACPTCKSSFVQ